MTTLNGIPPTQDSSGYLIYKIKCVEAGGILKGQALQQTGWNDGENAVEVVLADSLIGPAIGLATQELAKGEFGTAISAGALENIDTSAWAINTLLFVNGAGELTSTEPTTGYAQPIARVLRSHAINGDLQVLAAYPKQDADDVRYTPNQILKEGNVQGNLDITNSFLNFFNGTLYESFDARTSSDGVTVTMDLEQTGGGDLTMRFSDGATVLDCTPKQTIELTTGSDSSPQNNWIYILQSTKVLTKSTTGFPTNAEHIAIGYFFVPSATKVQANGGVHVNQNWNEHATGTDNQGHQSHMSATIRYGIGYQSGIDPNGTDQDSNSSYFDYVSGSEAYFKSASGTMRQMHNHSIPAIDSSGVQNILVANWNGDNYHEISNIDDIVDDSIGGSLSNKYFNVFFFASGNKGGEYSPLIAKLPSGSYSGETSAVNDVDKYDDLTMPDAWSTHSTNGVPICRMTLKYSGGTSTLSHVSTLDLRKVGASGGGSGTGASTSFADNQFSVFNVTDSTKIVDLDVSGVTTGAKRILSVPDKDGEIALKETQTSLIPNSGRFYIYMNNTWTTDSDDNYGTTYYQFNELAGTGITPTLEWEHKGFPLPVGKTIKKLIFGGSANATDPLLLDMELCVIARKPDDTHDWVTGIGNDAHDDEEILYHDNFMNPSVGDPFGNTTRWYHYREIDLDYTATDKITTIHVFMRKTAGSLITIDRYFQASYLWETY